MNKIYSFKILIGGRQNTYQFSAPYENGFVVSNCFCPNELILNEFDAFLQFVIARNGEIEKDFIRDCQSIIDIANYNHRDNTFSRFKQATTEVVRNHINQCGRVLFLDLLIYVDCMSYILKSLNYTDAFIRSKYPVVVKDIVEKYLDYVQDSYNLCPFKTSRFYRVLSHLVPE